MHFHQPQKDVETPIGDGAALIGTPVQGDAIDGHPPGIEGCAATAGDGALVIRAAVGLDPMPPATEGVEAIGAEKGTAGAPDGAVAMTLAAMCIAASIGTAPLEPGTAPLPVGVDSSAAATVPDRNHSRISSLVQGPYSRRHASASSCRQSWRSRIMRSCQRP